MAEVESQLESIFLSGGDIIGRTQILLHSVTNNNSSSSPSSMTESLKAFLTKLFSTSELSNHMTKQILALFVNTLLSLSHKSSEVFEEIAEFTLVTLKAQSNGFDEADYLLRDAMFEHYLATGEYPEAAQVLAGVNLESTARPFTDVEKVLQFDTLDLI